MICKNIRIRQLNYNRYFYCNLKKRVIILGECQKCLKIEPRKSKGINKVSKKRIFVKSDVYDEVLTRDKKCRLKDATCEGGLHLHHIYYRSERKDLINEPKNCIMLCTKHHKEVHSNKHYWQPKLLQMNNFNLQS